MHACLVRRGPGSGGDKEKKQDNIRFMSLPLFPFSYSFTFTSELMRAGKGNENLGKPGRTPEGERTEGGKIMFLICK